MLIIAWVSAPICSLPQSYFFNVRRHPLVENYLQCTPIGGFPSKHVVSVCLLVSTKAQLGLSMLLFLPSFVLFCFSTYDSWAFVETTI